MSSSTKKKKCGPPCQRCLYPVIDNSIVEIRRGKSGNVKTFTYHANCFPCRLCKKSKIGRMQKNGYHLSCQPCTGCGKPFKHSTQMKECSKRCQSRAPAMDIVLVASMRLNATLPQELMMIIFSFTFALKTKSQNFLSVYTISYIKEVEERNRQARKARQDRSLR